MERELQYKADMAHCQAVIAEQGDKIKVLQERLHSSPIVKVMRQRIEVRLAQVPQPRRNSCSPLRKQRTFTVNYALGSLQALACCIVACGAASWM
jgi:hypothetical protein